jgi:RNA polymerase sigma-70 factor (ECF subfamily)
MGSKPRERFVELLTPIAQAIQAYARHLAWSPNDVEDIFQTALLNAYRKFEAYEEGTNFKAWLLRFVTYAAFNANRRHEHIEEHELLTESEALAHFSATEALAQEVTYDELLKAPERVLDTMAAEIRQAIRTLPAKRRGILLLRTIGELSYREIAQVLEVPIGTVMGELWRARRQLRELLCEYAQQRGLLREGGGADGV